MHEMRFSWCPYGFVNACTILGGPRWICRSRGLTPRRVFPQCSRRRPPPRRSRAASGPGEVLRRKLPVDELLEQRVHVIGAPVLVVQIVGMLPHVDREQRLRTGGDRRLRVGGL